MSFPSNIPPPNVSFLDANGNVATVWWQYLLTLFNRTGGLTGTSPGGPPVSINLDASPLQFKAPADGTLFITGGGVSSLKIGRGTGSAFDTGQFYAPLPMSAGDTVTMSFITPPPTVTFLPR